MGVLGLAALIIIVLLLTTLVFAAKGKPPAQNNTRQGAAADAATDAPTNTAPRDPGPDLRNTQLESVGGQTGYYKNGVFVPLYNTQSGGVSADVATIRQYGSVAAAPPPQQSPGEPRKSRPSADAPGPIQLNITPGSTPGMQFAGLGTQIAFGSVEYTPSGIPQMVNYDNLPRGGRYAPGSTLPDSSPNYTVFDMDPAPTIPPQLRSIASAVSIQSPPILMVSPSSA